MNPGEIFIYVWDGRAAVARFESKNLFQKEGLPGIISFKLADNWEELESETIVAALMGGAIQSLGGSVNISGSYLCGGYPCPQTLADKAIWTE